MPDDYRKILSSGMEVELSNNGFYVYLRGGASGHIQIPREVLSEIVEAVKVLEKERDVGG